MKELREFLEECKHNQKVNFEKGLENRVDLDYVIERLENIKKYNVCYNIDMVDYVEDKEYEDIEELDLKELCEVWNLKEQAFENKINALIRNQKYILEQLNKEGK